jgi:murein DD-endopeptidase MepM/ murein hydrolase activator NlpD
MRNVLILFLLTSLLLTSCGSTELWGSYDAYLTPTASEPPADPDPVATQTATPTAAASLTPTRRASPTPSPTGPTPSPRPVYLYAAQSGDSLESVALHFEVQVDEISLNGSTPAIGYLNPGTLLEIPNRLAGTAMTPAIRLLPDSEVIFSPSSVAFDIEGYVNAAGGKLSTFREYMSIGWITGAEGVERMAYGSSISPRLLLAMIQYYTGWVEGQPFPQVDETLVLGYQAPLYPGLYQQMRLAVRDLEAGYYGWRAGTLTELTFVDGSSLRIAPEQNAGTVALYRLFAQRLTQAEWLEAIDPENGFMALYRSMFDDPWERGAQVGPLFPVNMLQPVFSLPFEPNTLWSLTGGPHPAWEQESALAALDFAPATSESGCVESNAWVVAIAPGQIVRSEGGYVVLDLDGDGFEQTGWVVLYMHIATKDRIPTGTWVNAGDRLGHPSCEGGTATGTHLHLARKYNGEWVAAGDPLPFVLSGWTAHYGDAPYRGSLTKGERTITASQSGTHESQIIRSPDE